MGDYADFHVLIATLAPIFLFGSLTDIATTSRPLGR
jgi:hypothetical protein